ncbi:MAG TPA: M48 family metalloprotease, partial [Natronosporangium sp.]|nr:M48 family metalloprotease [Natronosporangium sp.]
MSEPGWAAAALAALLVALVVVGVSGWPRGVPAVPRAAQLHALRSLPPDAVASGRAYHRAVRPIGYAAALLALAVLLALATTPAGRWLVDLLAAPWGGHWLATVALAGPAVVLAAEVATLPLAALRHRISVRHGLSHQLWRAWWGDRLKAYAVTVVTTALALAGLWTLIRLWPAWWWAPAAVGAAALVVLLSFVLPMVVEPLFLRFAPMPAGELRDRLTDLARRAGTPVRQVLVANASRRSRAVNAYVSGLGPSRRVVVFDTLLSAPPSEVAAVVAHELAHARYRDVAAGTARTALVAATAVTGLYLLGQWPPVLRLAGVETLADPRAVPLVVALAAVAGVVLAP